MSGFDWQRAKLRALVEKRKKETPGGETKSGFRGVHVEKGKYRVRITYEGYQYHLGYFLDAVTAARAYDQAARDAFGAEAILNFPDDGKHEGKNVEQKPDDR